MSQDGVVSGQGHRTLQRLRIHHLLFPAKLAHITGDVHLYLEVTHFALCRNQMEPSGGIVTSALAGKCPQGSGRAVTVPRLPNCPEPS